MERKVKKERRGRRSEKMGDQVMEAVGGGEGVHRKQEDVNLELRKSTRIRNVSGQPALTNQRQLGPLSSANFPLVENLAVHQNFPSGQLEGGPSFVGFGSLGGFPSGMAPPASFPSGGQQQQQQGQENVAGPPFPNNGANPGLLNPTSGSGFNPCFIWNGMKNIRDDDIDGMLSDHWNTQLVMVAFSSTRKMVTAPGNDGFVQSFTEPPWRDKGNVVFFCEGGKVVRCHAVVLSGVLPGFTNELLDMANFPYCAYIQELPYIPVFVRGVEQRCMENLLNLIFRGLGVLTGREVRQLIEVLNVLNIHELVISISPPGPACNVDLWMSGGGPTQSNAATPRPSAPGAGTTTTDASVNVNLPENHNTKSEELHNAERTSQNPSTSAALSSKIQMRTKKRPLAVSTSSESGDDSSQEMRGVEYYEFNSRQEIEVLNSQQLKSSSTSQKSTEPPGGSPPLPPPPGTPPPSVLEKSVPCGTVETEQQSNPVDSPVRRRRGNFRTKSEGGGRKRNRVSETQSHGYPSDGDDEGETDKKRRKRNVYPKEMRAKALAALNDGVTVRDIALNFNVPSKLISRWKYEAKKADDSIVVTLTDEIENNSRGNVDVGGDADSSTYERGMKEGMMITEPFGNSYMLIKQEPATVAEIENNENDNLDIFDEQPTSTL